MMRARIVGEEVWCGRPGCPYPNRFAVVNRLENGEPWAARLTSNRWRRDGLVEGLERYVMVRRTGRQVRTRPDGVVVRSRNLQMRAPLPCVIVCPACDAVQAIELT